MAVNATVVNLVPAAIPAQRWASTLPQKTVTTTKSPRHDFPVARHKQSVGREREFSNNRDTFGDPTAASLHKKPD